MTLALLRGEGILRQKQLEESHAGLLGRIPPALLNRPDGPDREVSLGGHVVDREALVLS
jgi:hypothetical protein